MVLTIVFLTPFQGFMPARFHNLRNLSFLYFACSNAKVRVGWSQTSVGPQYWMGPG